MLGVDNYGSEFMAHLFRWPPIEIRTVSPFLSWRTYEIATDFGHRHQKPETKYYPGSIEAEVLERVLAGRKLQGDEWVAPELADEMVSRALTDPQARFIVLSQFGMVDPQMDGPDRDMTSLVLGRAGNYEDFFDLELVAADYQAAGLPKEAAIVRGLRGLAISGNLQRDNFAPIGLSLGYPIETTLSVILHGEPSPWGMFRARDITTPEQALAGRRSFLLRDPETGETFPVEDALEQDLD